MDEKRKVAIISGQLVVGGAERQLYLWLAHMDREKFDPLVITLHPDHDDYWEKPIEDLGIPLFRVTERPAKMGRLVEIIKILKHFEPDLIQGWHFFSSVYAGLAARLLKVPCIGGIRSEFSPNKIRFDTTLFNANCDAVVANSNAAADAYRKTIGKRNKPVFTVPNAVLEHPGTHEELRMELVRAYGLPTDAIWICSVGRMDPLKRFDLMLEAAVRIEKSEPKYHMIIIGYGPEKAFLQDLARTLNISDKVSFPGEIPNAGNWMKAMDIFCFPSVSEGLPNAVMEAAIAGLPIVAWKLLFCQELLPNEAQAILVEPENVDEMALALSQLINSSDLRAQIGANARSHILENFGIERYVQNLTSVYDFVIRREKGSG